MMEKSKQLGAFLAKFLEFIFQPILILGGHICYGYLLSQWIFQVTM